MRRSFFTIAVLLVAAAPAQTLRRSFERPPDDARIMMRWWWFGPAVNKDQLLREMLRMKEGGIGGFEVQPVYALEVEGNPRFLSREFLDALQFTAAKAKELGLRFDLTLGSGWPYGGPHIPLERAAARLRVQRGPAPHLREGEALIATIGGRSFISSRTRQMVKRASAGAEGLVLDHYDRRALDLHLKHVGEPLLKAVQPHAVFCDSLEAFGSDWTGDLLEQFSKRRGYDLKRHLPALAGEPGPLAGAVRNDWMETLSDLAQERFLAPLQQWARSHSTRLRIQNYGTPPVTLASNAIVDLPEGEGSHWKRLTSARWASSAAHLLGRSVVSSETWTWLHSPAFRATPLDMKAEADRHFLQGITQLIGHGWPYSPERAGEPGWRFYAAAVFNHHNPWWMVMPELSAYMQRVSSLLRQGRPVAEVALYLPTADVRAATRLGEASLDRGAARLLSPGLIPQILDAGFSFDLVDDGLILEYARIEDRSLVFPGARFRIVILPNVERIPPAVLRKLEAFARAGGAVLAVDRTPSLAPGLAGDDAEVREISARLFASGAVPEQRLGSTLQSLLEPDAVLPSEVGFIHRSTPEGEVYFIANTSNRAQLVNAAFRAKGAPEFWDPFTGRITPGTRAIDLQPYESRVLVFVGPAPGLRRPPGPPGPAESGSAGQGPAPRTLDLSAGWRLTIGDHTRTVDLPHGWTDAHSGLATYEKSFTLPHDMPRAVLDLGEAVPLEEVEQKQPGMRAWLEPPVREAAVVYVNGRRAGSLWRPPYSVDLTGYLRRGRNTIRIEVANTAINRLAGGPPPDYRELHARYGRRFDPQDMEHLKPLPSGLLGPVRLRTRQAAEDQEHYAIP